MTYDEKTTCDDVVKAWDAGETIQSISMGGMGPGYEQCIQAMALEMLRGLCKRKPNPKDWEDQDKWRADRQLMDADAPELVERLGVTGAQFGAAINMACVFYINGPKKAMRMAPADRWIEVSNNLTSKL